MARSARRLTPSAPGEGEAAGAATDGPALALAYLAHLRDERRLSGHTLRNYGAALSLFLEFLSVHLGGPVGPDALSALQPRDIRAFLASRKAGGADGPTLRVDLAAVRGFFRFLERRGGLVNPAAAAVRSPKVGRRLPRPLSEADAKAVIGAFGDQAPRRAAWEAARDAALFALLYGAGLRISEALALRWGEAPLAETVEIRGKGGKSRRAPILPAVAELIEAYRAACPYGMDPADPLFFSVRGKALSARTAQARLQSIRAGLGLPATATPHALRHSFASHLLAAGGDLRTIQELLAATQRYTEIDAERLLSVYDDAHPAGARRRRSD